MEEVYTSSGNVFADLQLPDADEQMAKAELAAVVRRLIREQGLNRPAAAQALGVPPSRVADLYNGQIAHISYEHLLGFLNALDCDVQITLRPREAGKTGVGTRGKTLVARSK